MRALQAPASFEIVAEAGTIYYRIAFAPTDQQLIEGQLRIHFPSYGLLAVPLASSISMPVKMIPLRPAQRLELFKRIKEFALDPHTQLFPILEKLPANDVAIFQVIFTPIADEAIRLTNRAGYDWYECQRGYFVDDYREAFKQ